MKFRQVPPMVLNIIHTALTACDGVRFSAGDICPYCGAPLSGYDERKKRFAVLHKNESTAIVWIIIRRSWCRRCERIINPPEPFYPGTRIGAPVVDLCCAFSSIMPFNRTSQYLDRMGVVVDRWSVRHYAHIPREDLRTIDVFGMKLPVSIIYLSTLAGSLQEAESLDRETILEVCNYPSALQQPPDLTAPK